jgi:putative transposase
MKRCAGASRYVYNWGLAEWNRQYEAYREDNTLKRPSQYDLRTQFNGIKDELCPWIREVPYAITEAAFEALGQAFHRYLQSDKTGKRSGNPKFKNRSSPKRFRLRDVVVDTGAVKVPRLGSVRLTEDGYIPVSADYGTYFAFSERAGHWYISALVRDDNSSKPNLSQNVLGVDFGISALAVVSNGTVFENPQAIASGEAKIKRLSRELARRQKGGANRDKTREKIAREYARVTDVRSHTLHQISDYLTAKCKPQMIVLEDLNVTGMMKNHRLARAISDVSWSELRRQVEYKAAQLGIEVFLASQMYPSSKTCSRCGYIKADLPLEVRTFVCDDCGFTLDRDLNAAYNLAALGQKAQTAPNCLGS